jgi:triosephosphate isomerase
LAFWQVDDEMWVIFNWKTYKESKKKKAVSHKNERKRLALLS